MIFIILLILATAAVSGTAAFFSVVGLAQVFSGSYISVIVLGSSLEFAKLITASFLYRFWDVTGWVLKSALIFCVAVLMGITSMGVSGYLSAGYQIDTISLRDNETRIISAENELQQLQDRKTQIEKDINRIGANYVSARQNLMKTYKPEYDTLVADIKFKHEQILKFKTTQLQTETKVGPIIFISKVLGKETDDAVFWLIILLMLVSDPMAICLTLATNIAIKNKNILSNKQNIINSETVTSTTPTVQTLSEESIEELERKIEEFMKNRQLSQLEMQQKEELERRLKKKKILQAIRKNAN